MHEIVSSEHHKARKTRFRPRFPTLLSQFAEWPRACTSCPYPVSTRVVEDNQLSHEEAIMKEDTARRLRLSQPHFDQEATLVSARPVVPLAELHQTETRKRSWLFFSALILATLVGATGATLIYSRRAVVPVQEAEQVVGEASTEPKKVDLTEESASTRAEISAIEPPTVEAVPEETAAVQKKPAIEHVDRDEDVKRAKTVPRANGRDPIASVPARGNAADDDYRDWQETRRRRVQERREQLIDERREQRREARREARRQRRGQWRSGDGSAEDLFRIKEIFEGTRP